MNSRTMTIGRAPDNDLVAGDRHVSSHHARLLREGSSIIVEDLQSTNHTYVDGIEVTRKTVSVGDLIQLSFYYELDWNHPIVRQWLGMGSSASAGVPAVAAHGGSVERVSAPAAQWKGPDDDYCPTCGSVVRKGMKFCSGCGAQVGGIVSSSAREYPVARVKEKEPRRNGIPDRCPNCSSTNIKKLSVHEDSKKVSGGGSGCNSCLLLIIIAILAPGLILILGVGGALGLAGVTYFISENLEIVIPVAVALLIFSIVISVNKSKTYVCGKCGARFK